MVLVAYRHGLRAAELVTLRWDAIDFAHGRLHVRRLKGGSELVHPLCLRLRRARPPVSARQAPSRSGIGARGCKTPGMARILIPPFPGSNPGAPASQSLFLRGFMVLTPNAREHGACARGGSVSVSQSRAGSCRFGPLSLRANFGVSFLSGLIDATPMLPPRSNQAGCNYSGRNRRPAVTR